MSTTRTVPPIAPGSEPRYAIARGFRMRQHGCTLFLETPTTKVMHQLHIDCLPTRKEVVALREERFVPLAARLEFDEAGDVTCSAFLVTPTGPQRRQISLGAALALCVDGLHTVITRR